MHTLIGFLVFFPLLLLGQQITVELNFDTVPTNGFLDCGATWMEEGLTLELAANSQGGAFCSFDVFNNTPFLSPAQLRVDLSGLDVVRVEVDVNDFCGTGCTRAFLTSNGVVVAEEENTMVGPVETFIFQAATLGPLTDVRVESFEGEVRTIRVIYMEAVEPPDPDPLPLIEIIIDPSQPDDPNAFVICWTNEITTVLEQSRDLIDWSPVPLDQVEIVGPKATHNVSSNSVLRCYYRLLSTE